MPIADSTACRSPWRGAEIPHGCWGSGSWGWSLGTRGGLRRVPGCRRGAGEAGCRVVFWRGGGRAKRSSNGLQGGIRGGPEAGFAGERGHPAGSGGFGRSWRPCPESEASPQSSRTRSQVRASRWTTLGYDPFAPCEGEVVEEAGDAAGSGLRAGRRQHRGAVVGGQLPVCPVQFRLVAAGPVDRRLLVVWNHELGNASPELEHPDVRHRPVRQRPAPGHVHERVVRRPEDPDEDHGVPHLTRLPDAHAASVEHLRRWRRRAIRLRPCWENLGRGLGHGRPHWRKMTPLNCPSECLKGQGQDRPWTDWASGSRTTCSEGRVQFNVTMPGRNHGREDAPGAGRSLRMASSAVSRSCGRTASRRSSSQGRRGSTGTGSGATHRSGRTGGWRSG